MFWRQRGRTQNRIKSMTSAVDMLQELIVISNVDKCFLWAIDISLFFTIQGAEKHVVVYNAALKLLDRVF